MIPIYEQSNGKGIGHSCRSFKERFDSICQDDIRSERARAFAFILYDFADEEFRRVLRDQGVFTQLDRLAGRDLSVFYLHSARRGIVQRFNTESLARLGVEGNVRLPCVLFFRLKAETIAEVRLAQLESPDIIHAFHELYAVIEQYVNGQLSSRSEGSRYWRWLKSSAQFIGVESFRAILRSAFERVL